MLEKRFNLGDIINVPNFGDGTVEHIGFRSTTIRKFDSTPITIPNFIFADSAISNYSKRNFRRIEMIIGIEYTTSVETLKNIVNDIKDYLKSNKDLFIIDENHKHYVSISKFSDSSIDIAIYCFTNTNEYEVYLDIKEKLSLSLKNIVEQKNQSGFAFPSRSIYLKREDVL